MIVDAYGVPGITSIELALRLKDLKIDYGVVHQQRFTRYNVGEVPRSDQPLIPIVFTSGSMLVRTQKKFRGKTRVVALVVDNHVTLTRSLGLPLLGAETQKDFVSFKPITHDDLKSLLIAASSRETHLEVEDKKYKPFDEILKRYALSDLSKLQTFLYKIKDQDTRDKVSLLTKRWLLTSAPFSKIEGKLSRELKPYVVDTLRTMLTSPSVSNLRVAIKKVKSGGMTPVKAAKRFKVSAFDLRYLLTTK